VSGASDSPSTLLLAAWLQHQLQVPVDYGISSRANGSSGIHGVKLSRESGVIELERSVPNVATLVQPNQPLHDLALPRRSLRDCLAEELRRLDPDDLYGEIITKGVLELSESDQTVAPAAASTAAGA
jgi:glucose-6-phosphate dehydrogenase assembly protein OpcA